MTPLERLVEQYKKDGLVLFLGAGVSSESKIPNWHTLATRLLLKSRIPSRKIAAVRKALPSYITQFELAGLLLGKRKRLVEEIHRALYQSLDCRLALEGIPIELEKQNHWGSRWDDILKKLQANKTLKAVGDLLSINDGCEERRNPQIHAVLTSNADNLLEIYCLAKTRGRRLLTLVDRASVAEHPDRIPVYHLHGFLDARGENLFTSLSSGPSPSADLQAITEELLPDLIFRESEYYDTIANPSSFVNHTPQSFFRRLNVLFIGTSLDDLNMRRWLHDSYRERVYHRTKYLRELYRHNYKDANYEAALASRRHFWLCPETEKDRDKPGRRWKVPKQYVERVMSNLGVQVIWCKNYEDMRHCITQIQRQGAVPEFDRRPAQLPELS